MKLILLLPVLTCVWGLPPKNAIVTNLDGNTRIVGGEDIDIAAVPYQVSVLEFNSHTCGGSILNQNFILTAAHCIDKENSASAYSIRAGSSISNAGGVTKTVADTYIHPNYGNTLNIVDYDIAILRLASPLTYQTSIQPITLVKANTFIPAGIDALATGWGLTSEGGNLSTYLQAVTVPVVSKETCLKQYDDLVTERMLCAGYETGGRDSCTMDSGGPLVAAEYGQIGIVSWGNGCARPGNYGVYVNVTVLRPWIDLVAGL